MDASHEAGELPEAPTIGEVTPIDAALTVTGLIASAVPLVGGPAASVVAEVRRAFDRRQAARLAAVVNDLGRQLNALEDRIDRELGEDGAFGAFLEAAIQSAAEARNADKRRYYVALMARSATNEGPEAVQRGLLLDTLDRLRLTHLRLLHAVASAPGTPKAADFYRAGTPASEALREALPGIGEVFIHRAWEDLVALGLVESWTDYIVTEASPVSADGVITRFGREFLRFVSPF